MDGDRRLLHVLRLLLRMLGGVLGMGLCRMRMLLVGVGRRLWVPGTSSVRVAVAHNVVARGGGAVAGLGMGHRGVVMVRARRADVHDVWKGKEGNKMNGNRTEHKI